MYINKITFTPTYQSNLQTHCRKNGKDNLYHTNEYRPVAYQDYNISFGERLFRTPANFFAQDFNRNNMPETMSSYLFENYEDRQHIPPAQMMKIVFNDINKANSLEEVKEYFNEPLFNNLQSMKNKKYREGVLAEINIMKEPDKSLFKDGSDNLGLYILKKIYLEGKTLKEINKDFKNDISAYYRGLSDITYRDMSNFGIKFPNIAFWHSFIVTRDDFPYIPIKRKDAQFHASEKGKRELTLSDINKGDFRDKRPPKYNLKEHEIRDITGAVLEDFGDKERINKNLKRKLKSDDPKLSFIQKYMSEIMSISLDRVHASDEMRSFFDNYENFDKSARVRLKRYWDNTPEMKALQGLIMSDTIKLFFEYYGPDGNNELFQDLINYAHSIKPQREEEMQKHNLKQQYYDEIGKELDEQELPEQNAQVAISPKQEQLISFLDGTPFYEKNFKDKMTFTIDGSNFNIYANIDDEFSKSLSKHFEHLMPDKYIAKYMRYLSKSEKFDKIFKLSVIIKNSDQDYSAIQSMLYDDDKLRDINEKTEFEFMKKYPLETDAAHQAFVDTVCKYIPETREALAGYLYKALALDIPSIANELSAHLEGSDTFMQDRYDYYLKPISYSESKEISKKICNDIMNDYNMNNSLSFKPNTKETLYFEAFSRLFRGELTQEQKNLRYYLEQYIAKDYGGTARAILDDSLPLDAKIALSERIISGFIVKYRVPFSKAIANNMDVKLFLFKHFNKF